MGQDRRSTAVSAEKGLAGGEELIALAVDLATVCSRGMHGPLRSLGERSRGDVLLNIENQYFCWYSENYSQVLCVSIASDKGAKYGKS